MIIIDIIIDLLQLMVAVVPILVPFLGPMIKWLMGFSSEDSGRNKTLHDLIAEEDRRLGRKPKTYTVVEQVPTAVEAVPAGTGSSGAR